MDKTFNGESDSSGITNSCSGCGRPHNGHPTAKINKAKDLALIFRSVSLSTIKTSCSVKNILNKRFSTYFIYSHPFNDMFIVNGKSHCCNDTSTAVRITSLLAKNI